MRPGARAATVSEPVWDIAVVGAGPAGSSAAHAALRAGASVVLLERAAIPRYKTCGGGLVGTSLALVSPYAEVPTRASVRSATFTLNGSRPITHRVQGEPFLGMVDRAEFDAALATAARAAGAEVRTGVTVRRLVDLGNHVRLDTSTGSVASRVVIGADGSASRMGTYVGVRCAGVDLGLEVELPLPERRRSDWDGHMLIDWGPLPGSYGWIFPKGDAVTVGVIAARGAAEPTRAYLADLLARFGLQGITPRVQSGHLTRYRRRGSPLRRGRVLVVGDAAGLLEPCTREGISFAIRSGMLAGQAAAAAASQDGDIAADRELRAYERGVARNLGPAMHAGASLRRTAGRYPLLVHALLATPTGWSSFVELSRGARAAGRFLEARSRRSSTSYR